MFFLLFFVYLIVFIIGLNIFRTRLNPVTAFTIGFVACMCVCLINYDKWDMERFHFNTFCLLCFGCLSFVLGCIWFQLYYKGGNVIIDKSYRVFNINKSFLLIYLLFVVVIVSYSFSYLISVTGAENISQAAFINYHAGFVEGDNNLYQLPLVPRLLKSIVIYLNYYFLFILANKIVHKEPLREMLLLMLICIVSSMSNLTTGSRGSIFEPILYFLIVYLCLKNKKEVKNNIGKIKKIIFSIFVSSFILFIFFKSGSLAGRDTSDSDFVEYMSGYVGAQPKNLDLFINEYHMPNNTPGGYTFGGIFSSFIDIKPVFEMSMPRDVNGHSLGNVYSGFSSYYYDFGIFGSIIFCFFLGIFFQFLYVNTFDDTRLNKRYFLFSIFFYAYFLQGLILNFFGERVCRLFSPLTLKCIIVIFVFDYLIRHITKCQICNK